MFHFFREGGREKYCCVSISYREISAGVYASIIQLVDLELQDIFTGILHHAHVTLLCLLGAYLIFADFMVE